MSSKTIMLGVAPTKGLRQKIITSTESPLPWPEATCFSRNHANFKRLPLYPASDWKSFLTTLIKNKRVGPKHPDGLTDAITVNYKSFFMPDVSWATASKHR
jgi:hypothetical protein